jgi:pSer/pThr/pTyr-binding forkhead associated (FHA) protein
MLIPTYHPAAPPGAHPAGTPPQAEAAAAPAPPAEQPEPAVAETMFLSPDAAPPGAEPGLTEAELTIETGPDSGHMYRLNGPALRVGRSPDNELILRDPATSGHHARVERRGQQFVVVDLGSTNGTMVNGETVQEHELKHGDRITIGQNTVKFTLV